MIDLFEKKNFIIFSTNISIKNRIQYNYILVSKKMDINGLLCFTNDVEPVLV